MINMVQNERISVIVPVYKVEPYLDRCIQSIVEQTYKNLEIILVDDGSPDNCGAMCDAWAERDRRIKVIHKENGGAGKARNVAMDMATGDFISFIDSDDYIEPHMYAHLMSLTTEDTDIAECALMETESDDAPLDGPEDADVLICNAEEAMAHHIRDRIFRQTPPNKIYRRSTVGDIRFPVGNRIDDEFFTYRVIANCRKLAHSDRKMYAYRQQPGSVMHLSFSMPRLQALDAKCQRLDLLQERFPALTSHARINLWYTCLYMGQMTLLCMNAEEQEKAFGKITNARRQYPLTRDDRRTLPLKQRVWMRMGSHAFRNACRLRNKLKIGI
jgi:hypothetical protein